MSVPKLALLALPSDLMSLSVFPFRNFNDPYLREYDKTAAGIF